ncbi:aconitase X swivel domain-containing protein [Mesorhizobium xinjiangense]|uniref:aconitase X swivel domain-containing protein n=1 Tax=Mesorhizobium xinjiangense TaxID=2678685 RepID=UPI0012ED58F1|nr:DUF126 domain-containing protein [Mesorhizobium xinjiangense]
MKGDVLVAAAASGGPALVLDRPISFWGGVDARTGRIADVRHPQHGQSVTGTVLFVPATIGSSSASAVLMELVHRDLAPAAIVLHEPDAILLLGLIVAREMGWPIPPAVKLDRRFHARFRGQHVSIDNEGAIDAPVFSSARDA